MLTLKIWVIFLEFVILSCIHFGHLKKNYRKYYSIILLHKLIKKLAHKKFREAHNFILKKKLNKVKETKLLNIQMKLKRYF